MFPGGAPVDSIYNVQNKSFKTCGEIVAASLAQGGPPPSFLAEPVYELMLTLEVNLDQLDAETHFTLKDQRRKLEEEVMDNFQDFLSTVAWREKNDITDENGVLEAEKYQAGDVSPAGVLGWLTGQQHRPVNGEQLTIRAHFDHDCMERNPKHTICFPQVGACSREITFPVAHMTDTKEFEHIFLLALCKGGAFSKA